MAQFDSKWSFYQNQTADTLYIPKVQSHSCSSSWIWVRPFTYVTNTLFPFTSMSKKRAQMHWVHPKLDIHVQLGIFLPEHRSHHTLTGNWCWLHSSRSQDTRNQCWPKPNIQAIYHCFQWVIIWPLRFPVILLFAPKGSLTQSTFI